MRNDHVAVSRVPVLGAGVAVRPQQELQENESIDGELPPPAGTGVLNVAAPALLSAGTLTADTSEQVEIGAVSSKSNTIDFKVSTRIREAHVTDYPARIRKLNWPHVRSSDYVSRHIP